MKTNMFKRALTAGWLATCLAASACSGDTATNANREGLPDGYPAEAACPQTTCAIAAAEHMISLESSAAHGDIDDYWAAITMDTCEFCRDTLAVAAENRASGATFTGGDWEILPQQYIVDRFNDVGDQDPDGENVVLVILIRQGQVDYTQADGATDTIDEQVVTLWVGMEWNGAFWATRRVGLT